MSQQAMPVLQYVILRRTKPGYMIQRRFDQIRSEPGPTRNPFEHTA